MNTSEALWLMEADAAAACYLRLDSFGAGEFVPTPVLRFVNGQLEQLWGKGSLAPGGGIKGEWRKIPSIK